MASLWRVSVVLATPDACHHPGSGISGCHPAQGLRKCGVAAPLRSGDPSPFAAAGDGIFGSPLLGRLSRELRWRMVPAAHHAPLSLPWLMASLQGLSWGFSPAGCGGDGSRLSITFPSHFLGLSPSLLAPLAPLSISSARAFFRNSTDAASTRVLLFLGSGQKPCSAGALIASLPPFPSLNLPWDCSFRVPQMRPPRRRFAGSLPCVPTAVPWWS